jgi:hypothetical protein
MRYFTDIALQLCFRMRYYGGQRKQGENEIKRGTSGFRLVREQWLV